MLPITLKTLLLGLNKSETVVFVKKGEEMTTRMQFVYDLTRNWCLANVVPMTSDEVLRSDDCKMHLIYVLDNYRSTVYRFLKYAGQLILGVAVLEEFYRRYDNSIMLISCTTFYVIEVPDNLNKRKNYELRDRPRHSRSNSF